MAKVDDIIAKWESVHAHMPVCEVEEAEWQYDMVCDPEHIALMEAVIYAANNYGRNERVSDALDALFAYREGEGLL